MSTNISQLPQDKTPAQRAQIKLWEQFGVVFFVNAGLAAYVLLSSYGTGQKPNWAIVIIAALAQGVIAAFNVAEKYFSAKNEPLYSAFVEAGRQEVLAKAPPVPYSPTDQALLQAANAAFQPTYTYNAPVMPAQSAVVPSSLRPTVLTPIPATPTPVVPPSVPNVPPDGAMLSGTIPAMPVVNPQQ
jgi:hypothetical protein